VTQAATLEPMARTLSYRIELSGEDRAAILELPHHVRTIERGHFVVRDREKTVHSCVILSGACARSKIVGTGQRQIVAVHMRGDMVDLQNSLLEVADHSVEALITSKVAMIPRDEIVRLAEERPQVGRALWLDTLVEGSVSREWVANVGRRDARTRIAHLLCEFAVRLRVAGLAEGDSYELPMTQEQVADATGLTSVHVNRTIRALEAEGLIERPHPRAITYRNWRRIAEVGDFDTNYLHLRHMEPALQ
jgi:CRP-like cAMP-binding protein